MTAPKTQPKETKKEEKKILSDSYLQRSESFKVKRVEIKLQNPLLSKGLVLKKSFIQQLKESESYGSTKESKKSAVNSQKSISYIKLVRKS